LMNIRWKEIKNEVFTHLFWPNSIVFWHHKPKTITVSLFNESGNNVY
jgi:hypothetical protein